MWQYNYSPELYHYGVMGMKWGHRKQKQADMIQQAANKAKENIKMAKADYERFSKTKPRKGTKNDVGLTSKEINRWKKVAKQQEREYGKLYEKYSKIKTSDINRKSVKAAKKFLKTTFENADFTDGNYGNYQLETKNRRYDYETGKLINKKK